MKNVLAVVTMTALVLAGTAGPASAAKSGVCQERPAVNLKLCASINYGSGEAWMTGQGTEIINTAFGEYAVQGVLQRTRCSATSWQNVAVSEQVRGNDRLQVITTDIRLQRGYRYRAVISAVASGPSFAAVSSPVLNRC